jgi:hypothetical protein
MSKINQILKELDVINNTGENNTLTNLTKTPLKEPNSVMPHTTASQKFATEQADLLFLPEDEGYKYLLVVVDIATRLCDAEPLKSKDSKIVAKALQKIFKRKIIEKPLRLEVDAGKEFKGEFKSMFHKMFKIVEKIAGRHRQQSVVETKNYQIGKILNTRMLAEEINSNEVNRNWVDILPKVIKLINQHFSHAPVVTDVNEPIRTNKYTSDLLPIGSKVRIQLDNPEGYAEEEKLHGRFRAGDICWTKTIHIITQYYLRPDQPPMYQVDNNERVAYTKYQLQVVRDDEVKPKSNIPKKYIIRKLLKKLKVKNKIYFEVLWGDGSKTKEPRSELIKDVPDLVKDFERLAKNR